MLEAIPIDVAIFDRPRDVLDHPRCQLVDPVGHLRVIGDDADEFIAAEPGQNAAFGQQALDPSGGDAQHFVARLVAVEVVDLLEIVEIHRDRRQRFLAAFQIVQKIAQRSGETAAVLTSGEVVDIGEAAGLFLGFAARIEFLGERLVAMPAEQDQRNVEQEGIGQRRIGRGVVARPCLDQVGQHHAGRAHEQDDRRKSDPQRHDIMVAAARLHALSRGSGVLGRGLVRGQSRPLAWLSSACLRRAA